VIKTVVLSKKAVKDIKKVPLYIKIKLDEWTQAVSLLGLEEVRKNSGYHDEPLKGDRFGQRSIRLNKAYRAIYIIKKEYAEFILIEEVNKHDY
jgi:proteic killer suppression protein